ncbi:MAG: hypothetical protein O2944_09545, partial [Proteobacteria bacterium]|nr:hypothetical protein [Pseudomonadota bacterium]
MITAVLAILSVGLIFLRNAPPWEPFEPVRRLEWVLIALIFVVLALDVVEALAPQADADTMAYHFETPRRFLARAQIFAIPRAIDGATPHLMHLGYAAAIALGGEFAANAWLCISGWGLAGLFYALIHRHVDRTWALLGVLLVLTTPAVVFSAGTGQAEVRTGTLMMLAAFAAARVAGNGKIDPTS